jgi:hypothetical protein
MMNDQRRMSLRKAPERLTYINLQSGYAGIVRDISDGGLRFRVIDPLQESEQVHFWFVANFSRIGGTGNLIWMDETKKPAVCDSLNCRRKVASKSEAGYMNQISRLASAKTPHRM